MKTRYDIIGKKDLILSWVAERKPKAHICSELKCKPLTLDMYLKKWGVDYKGNAGRKGNIYPERRVSAIEYMAKDSINVPTLRMLLIRDGIKEAKCENPNCGIIEWQGYPAPLELHHKDGNHYNNVLPNLEILCSNCHSIADRKLTECNIKPKQNRKGKPKKNCECGNLIELDSIRCVACEKLRKIGSVRPTFQTLTEDVKLFGYRKTAEKYNVTHTTVQRWVKQYNK